MHNQQTDEPEEAQSLFPLIVDLDGTLIRTDSLHEAFLAMAKTKPWKILQVPNWLSQGRACLKAGIAAQGMVAPNSLPYNEKVIELLKVARAEGRMTALVSAADHRQVTAIADETDLFDEAYGSTEGNNLKGEIKAAFLIRKFGDGMFDYVGNSKADLPVWKAARRATTVRANLKLRKAAEAVNTQIQHIDSPHSSTTSVIKALRPHQWVKNLLIFLPSLAAHDAIGLVSVVQCFIAFCLVASAAYIINDLLDLAADRAHPRKRHRPFAAGDLLAGTGLAMTGGLLASAFLICFFSENVAVLFVLLVYLTATIAYSLWLKQRLLVDLITLGGLYSMRIFSGAVAANLVLSPWILGVSLFFFLSLAAVKRQAELMDQLRIGRVSAGRAYEVEDLPILRAVAISAAQSAAVVLALYISSEDVQRLYPNPVFLWLICPISLYWLLRMIMKAHRGAMTDDPIVFAITDRISLVLAIAAGTLVAMAAN